MPGQGQGNNGNNGNQGQGNQGQGNQGQGQGNQGQGNQGQGNNSNQTQTKKWEPVGLAQQSAEQKKIVIQKIKRINTGFDNFTETISEEKEKEVLQQLNISKIRSNESKKN